ncbi:hypothetical protein GCM10009682_26590 [Luedemannella flava]|uniref:Uncharacterized protein n=1 Tax=Luedemannella flava TaxID=349316 RepID=A0ABN2M1F5_9ACTN
MSTRALDSVAPVPVRWRVSHASVVVGAWVAVIVTAVVVQPSAALRPYALFAHLISLAVGFGAVLCVECYSVAWLLRRTTLERVTTLALTLDPLIWIGLVGLAGSGLLLSPHLDRPLTALKMVLVLVVGLNGVRARRLGRDLRGFLDQHASRGRHAVDESTGRHAVVQVNPEAAVALEVGAPAEAVGTPKLPLRIFLRAASISAVSQAAWWGAALIGFLNTMSHS